MTAHTPDGASDSPLHTEWPALLMGESRLEWLPAGTTVVVLAGSVTLEHPPRWLADGTYRVRQTFNEGHAHVLEASGWWGLYADRSGGAQLRLLVPAVPMRRWPWLAPLRRWLALLSGWQQASRRQA